ncbi:MAG: RHS repeat-associated core domain-containing protein [Caldilineaceae bacterium]
MASPANTTPRRPACGTCGRDLHPALGRFLSADPVSPNAPGTQGYNRYAYVANNPTTWVDPSGFSIDDPLPDNDASILGLMTLSGFGTGIGGVFNQYTLIVLCALQANCDPSGSSGLVDQLGSAGETLIEWTAESLYQVLFSTYPHQPTPVSPVALALSLALSNTPVWGDLYDLATAVTGYDVITENISPAGSGW